MKLVKKIDRFFNPKKYYDDRITKPIKQLQRGDMVYILLLPKEGKEDDYTLVTYRNFNYIAQHIILYHGKIVNMNDCVKENEVCLEVAVKECSNDYASLYINDFKICKKNIIPSQGWNGIYYVSTNKKDIADKLNFLNAWVETNFKEWKQHCFEMEGNKINYWFSESPTKKLMQDLKSFKKKMSNVKYELKLL